MPQTNWSEFQSLDAFRPRQIAPGDLVRPWIGAGPFFHDLSDEVPGRSFFEDLESNTGEETFRRCLAEGETCLQGSPIEGDDLTYLGETFPFEVIDNEEPLINWGKYSRGNSLAAMFVSTRVRPERSGPARFRMLVRIDNQVVVAVNGCVQFSAFAQGFVRTNNSWLGEQTLDFDLRLSEGENVVTIGAFRFGRIASGSMFLQSLDTSLCVDVPLQTSFQGRSRVGIEATRDLFHPAREWFYSGESILLVRQIDPVWHETEVECEIAVRGQVLVKKTVTASIEKVNLGRGEDVGSGDFEVRTTAIVNGTRLPGRNFTRQRS